MDEASLSEYVGKPVARLNSRGFYFSLSYLCLPLVSFLSLCLPLCLCVCLSAPSTVAFLFLVAMPFVPSSVLVPSSKARSLVRSVLSLSLSLSFSSMFVSSEVFTSDRLYEGQLPSGTVTGLAWTAMGGSVLYIVAW